MPNIELRWIIPEGTNVMKPVLQYRQTNVVGASEDMYKWISVPFTIVPMKEFLQNAKC